MTGGCEPNQGPTAAEGEIYGDVYENGDRACNAYSVELFPADPSRLHASYGSALVTNPDYYQMFEWWDPASNEVPCYQDAGLAAFPSLGADYAEVHGGSGNEKHCVRPGRYTFHIEDRALPVDYLQPTGTSINSSTATALGLDGALAESPTYSASSGEYMDLVIDTDFTTSTYSDTPLLDIQNAGSNPDATTFTNASSPSGTAADWFRFSAIRSTHTWAPNGQSTGNSLARLYFSGPGLSASTGYWHYRTEGRDMLRIKRFPNPTTASATYKVGLEILRPDEEPSSTDTVARSIVINRLNPDLEPGTVSAASSVSAGSSLNVSVQHRNTVAAAFAVAEGGWTGKLYLSADAAVGGDVQIGSYVESQAINPGTIVTRSYSATIPSGQTPGTYYLIVQLDANGTVLEVSNSNNHNTAPPTISITGLQVTGLWTSDCERYTSGGKQYNRWTQSWTGTAAGSTTFEILRSATNSTGSGTVISSGSTTGNGSVSWSYLVGGTTYRYFWIRFSNGTQTTPWFESFDNPLNVSGNCDV